MKGTVGGAEEYLDPENTRNFRGYLPLLVSYWLNSIVNVFHESLVDVVASNFYRITTNI